MSLFLWLLVTPSPAIGFFSQRPVFSPHHRGALFSTTKVQESVSVDDSLASKWGVALMSNERYVFNCVDPDYVIEEFEFTIVKDPGLGIELTEVAAADGVGVVVVSGVVPDSPAASSPIKPGDVISKVGSVQTEAKVYDDLVRVLVQADPVVEIVVKRLIKRFKATLSLENAQIGAGENDGLYSGENLRRGLIARGVKVNDAKLGSSCGGDGACTTCAVEVLQGAELLNDITSPERVIFKSTPTWRLACQAKVKDDDERDSKNDDDNVLKLRIYPHRSSSS